MKHRGTFVTIEEHIDYSLIRSRQNVHQQHFLAKVMKNLKGVNASPVVPLLAEQSWELKVHWYQNLVGKWVIILIKLLEEEAFIS